MEVNKKRPPVLATIVCFPTFYCAGGWLEGGHTYFTNVSQKKEKCSKQLLFNNAKGKRFGSKQSKNKFFVFKKDEDPDKL